MIQKLFWIVLVTGCNLYLILNTITFIDTYNRKLTSTNVYLRKEMPSIFPVVVLCNVNIINSDKKDKILKKINEMNRIKGRNMSAKFDFRTITELQAIEVLNTVPCLTAFLFLVNFFVSKIARKNAIGKIFGIHIMEPALHSTMIDVKMGALNNEKRFRQTLGYQVLWNWSLIFRRTFIMI